MLGVSIQLWGRAFDHGMVECRWKAHITAPTKIRKPDFSALKDTDVAKKFDDAVSNILTSEIVNTGSVAARLHRLNRATKEAITLLPPKKRQSIRKRYVSDQTRELIAERVKTFQNLIPAERRICNREISRSCRDDYRTYIRNVVGDISAAASAGNMREVSRLTKSISSASKSTNIMPSKSCDGTPFTSMDQLLKAWQAFLERKFAYADRPAAVFAPGIHEVRPDEDVVSREEFNECFDALRTGRAPGHDETPIEAYKSSSSAKDELYELICVIWRTEDIPADLVHALFVML